MVSTNRARLRLSLGNMGAILVRKLVKPTKVVCSWAPYQRGFGQVRPSQTESDVGTAGAGVLGKADATVRQKLGCFDSLDRILDQLPEFFALFVADDGPEVLNLDQPLADKDHLRDICDTGDPGIANQLRIEGQQPVRLLRVAAGGGLPLKQARDAIQLAQGVDVGHEIVLPGQGLGEFHLQVAPRLTDADAVVLGKAIKQLHAGLQHAVPAIPLGIVEAGVPVRRPFPVEHRGGILSLKVSRHGLLKGPPKQHGRPGVFLFPAVEVAMLVAARAGQVLADLGIAVGHEDTSDPR